jgi:hypothetical protein
MSQTNRQFAECCAEDLRFSDEAIARLKNLLPRADASEKKIIQKMIDAHMIVYPSLKRLSALTAPDLRHEAAR